MYHWRVALATKLFQVDHSKLSCSQWAHYQQYNESAAHQCYHFSFIVICSVIISQPELAMFNKNLNRHIHTISICSAMQFFDTCCSFYYVQGMCVCWFDENYPKFLVYLVHEPRKMHIRGARSDSQTGPRNMSEQSIFIVFLFRLLAIATVNEFTAKYANETGKGRTLKIYRNGIFSRFTINDPKASGYINIQYMQYRARTYRIYRVDSRLQSNTML